MLDLYTREEDQDVDPEEWNQSQWYCKILFLSLFLYQGFLFVFNSQDIPEGHCLPWPCFVPFRMQITSLCFQNANMFVVVLCKASFQSKAHSCSAHLASLRKQAKVVHLNQFSLGFFFGNVL